MVVAEITVPSKDLPDGLSFGPVTVDSGVAGSVDARDELPVTLTPCWYQFLGVRWYVERYRTRGVFNVIRDQILFTPTAPLLLVRAAWWRRLGYRLLACCGRRAERSHQHAAADG
jgi:hypothetical protein